MENQPPTSIETGTELDNFYNLSFDTTGLETLRQLSLWTKIISICAFIGYVFSLASAFFGHARTSPLLEDNSSPALVARTSSVLGAIVVVVIGAALNYYLYRFAVSIDRGVKSMDALKVNEGFNSLRIYFRFVGILLIIALAILVVAILIGIASMVGR